MPHDDRSDRSEPIRDAGILIMAIESQLDLLRQMGGEDVGPKIAELETLLREIRDGIKPNG